MGRVKMSGALPLLSLNVFMTWTGITLTIYLYFTVCKIINTVTHFGHAYVTGIHVSRLVYCGQEFSFGIYTNVLP